MNAQDSTTIDRNDPEAVVDEILQHQGVDPEEIDPADKVSLEEALTGTVSSSQDVDMYDEVTTEISDEIMGDPLSDEPLDGGNSADDM